ncbi:hypothetical protein PG994_014175 [Apiospora phragmitis]|uniref:Uncharacterized protein n=1 Tax=Apiospora phragmitis TaxID=2905665 RepID=A0ABR1T3L7_9PEZI
MTKNTGVMTAASAPAAISSLEAAGPPPVPAQEKGEASRHDGSQRYQTSPAPTAEAGDDTSGGGGGGNGDLTQEKTGESIEYITGFKLLAVMIAVVLAAFLMLLDISIISTWTFLIFFLVFEVGSLVCGVATSSPMFIGGRVIAGLGSSGIMNGAMTLIAGAVPLEKRPCEPFLLLFLFLPLFLTRPWTLLLTKKEGKKGFYINLPIGGVTAVFLAMTHVPDITEKPPLTRAQLRRLLPELDLLGFALFTPAGVMFLLALQLGGHASYAWGSAPIVGLFCGAAATAAVFVTWEWRMGERAMLPGRLMRRRVVLMALVQGSALMITTTVGSFYLPIYFQGVKGVGPTLSGVYMLPSILSQLLLVVVCGALSKLLLLLPSCLPRSRMKRSDNFRRSDTTSPFAVFGGALNSIGNGLLSTFTPSTEMAKWVGYQIITGAGRGAAMQIVRYIFFSSSSVFPLHIRLQPTTDIMAYTKKPRVKCTNAPSPSLPTQCIIAIQSALQPAQIPVGMSAMIFAQNFSAAVFTVVAATIFTTSLEAEVTARVPSIPPAAVSAAGASGAAVQALVPPGSPPEVLGEVLTSYANSVDRVFYLVTACAVVTFVTAWGVGWKDTRQKKTATAAAAQLQGDAAA